MCGRQKTVVDDKKEDADSPTVATESVFITTAVEAHEGQDVATFDTTGEYLHTETYEDVIMSLQWALDELMAKVAPKIYQKYVITSSKGKLLLYVQIKKALYWLLRR